MISLAWFAAATIAVGASLPLVDEAPEGGRVVAFETETLTWASLDVTPDGETIVFEALGDIYHVPIEGGRASAITTGMAFDSQPTVSPDGRRIAFISDRDGSENLWMMDIDGGEPLRLSKGNDRSEFASPHWAPDSSHVLVSQTSWGLRTFEIWSYHVDGGRGVQITRAKNGNTPTRDRSNALGVVYSPDASRMYYAFKRGGFGYNLTLPLWQIARRDVADGTQDIVTSAVGSAFRPTLSPDGNLLAYGTRFQGRTGLRLRDLATGRDEWLIYPIDRDEQESRFTRDLLPRFAFLPDGSGLVLPRDGRFVRLDIETKEVQPIPVTVPVELTLGPSLEAPYRLGIGPVKARLIRDADWHPDRMLLTFAAFLSIYSFSLETNTVEQLTPDGQRAFQPAHSPDGRWISYVTWSRDGGHIWKIRTNGRGRAIRLTETPAYYHSPTFTPDGDSIIAIRASSYERQYREFDFGQVVDSDIIAVDAAGDDAIREILPARGLANPHFVQEGDRLYLYGTSQGLVSMQLDGTDLQRHLRAKGHGIYGAEDKVAAEDIRLSPTAREALVRHANQLYVVRLPSAEMRNLEVDLTNPTLPVARVTDIGADDFGWSADGTTLHWTTGDRWHRRDLGSISFRQTPQNATSNGEATSKPLAEEHESVRSKTIDLYLPRQTVSDRVALVGATILTMAEGAQAISDGVVVVADSRIEAVGSREEVDIEGIEAIDLSGTTLLPGFIDTHAHYRPMRDVFDAENWAFLANLAFGVTTGLDVQPSTTDILAYEDLVDAGLMLGPRALSTGPGIFNNNEFKSRDHARAVLARYKSHYRVRNLKSYIAGSRRQRQWILQAARDLRLMPTAEGALDMKLDLTHVIDGYVGNEHNFPLTTLHDDVVRLVAESGIGYNPTLLVAFGGPGAENFFYTRESLHDDERLKRFTPPQLLESRINRRPWAHDSEHVFPALARQAAKIIRAGGRVGVGGHGQLQGLGYHWELWALARGGLTPEESLAAATRHGAEIVGVADDLGTIEPGKLADLVALERNPLDDIRATREVRFVMKNGALYRAATLEGIWPVATEAPGTPWLDALPPAPQKSP